MLFAVVVGRRWGRVALHSITIFPPRCVWILSLREPHCHQVFKTTAFQKKIHDEQTRKMCPKIGRNVLHTNMMFFLSTFFQKMIKYGAVCCVLSHSTNSLAVESRSQQTLSLTYIRESGKSKNEKKELEKKPQAQSYPLHLLRMNQHHHRHNHLVFYSYNHHCHRRQVLQ